MDITLYIIVCLVSFLASVAGAVCGIGGGVIIKPVLDAADVMSVASISFLSGCTVLAMSGYTFVKGKLSGDSLVEKHTGTPLALGGAAGGILGKMLFQTVSGMFADKEMVGAVQAACLILLTVGTLVYTLCKERVRTKEMDNVWMCLGIGLVLGILSSFLGIGGGPMNLVILYYFFSMDEKKAAQNSLYIILFSQLASLLFTWITGTIPEFPVPVLLLMIGGGVLGGVSGRFFNRKLDAKAVRQLFLLLMLVIILINVYNVYQFML